jgi:hypothetical protein
MIKIVLVSACLANAQLQSGVSAETQTLMRRRVGEQDSQGPGEELAQLLLSMNPAVAVKHSYADARPLTRQPNAMTRSTAAIASAVDIVTGWQDKEQAKIVSTLGLKLQHDEEDDPDFLYHGYDGKGLNVKWSSTTQIRDLPALYTMLTGWVAAASDVPHLVTSIDVSDTGIHLYIDLRARGDAGYDLSYATLDDYPMPTERKATDEKAMRTSFAAFYTDELVQWKKGVLALDGADVQSLPTNEQVALLSASPMLIDVMLPLTDAAATAAVQACTETVDVWLKWMTSVTEMGRKIAAGAKQAQTLRRDDTTRLEHVGFMLRKYTPTLGEAAEDLAYASAGPLNEEYTGGFS